MSGLQKDIEVIEYPNKTSEWGKTLIDNLNDIFSGIIQNITGQLEALKLEIVAKVDGVQKTATDALTLAQDNQQKIDELTLTRDSMR